MTILFLLSCFLLVIATALALFFGVNVRDALREGNPPKFIVAFYLIGLTIITAACVLLLLIREAIRP